MSEKRTGIFLNFIIRAVVGMSAIFFINEFLTYKEIPVEVGLNEVSFLTSGILGIPGVALLYGILFYRIL